jgi:hypothetical protein
MLLAGKSDAVRNEFEQHLLHERIRRRHAPGGLFDSSGFDRLANQRNPEAKVWVSEAAKWFSQRHVANNVECRVCEPVRNLQYKNASFLGAILENLH